MKINSATLFCKRRFFIVTIYLFTLTFSFAQEVSLAGSQSLGKIPVYTFRFDTLNYKGMGKELSAIGTELSADLYITKIDNTSYFNIVIDGQSYAVISNPYSLLSR